MAHIVFIAKRRANASYQLAGRVELGRSVECDIFVPDVFTSRRHCVFTPSGDGWVIEDLDSRNGIYFRKRKVRRRVLQHGDRIEIGSFTLLFDEGDLPLEYSTPIPFGEGTTVVPLMDTLFSGELRPSEYLKASRKKPSWVQAREAAEERVRRQREAQEAAARELAERLNYSDGFELDLEAQIEYGAEDMLPAHVLVPRELAEQILGPGAAMYGQPALESAGAIDEVDTGNLEGFERLSAPPGALAQVLAAASGSAQTVLAQTAAASGAGASAPQAGPRRGNLWEQASSVSQTAIAPAQPASSLETSLVKIEKPSLRERLREKLRVDLSLGSMLEAARANVLKVAAAAVLLIGLSVVGLVYLGKPSYRSPDLSRMTPVQIKALKDAAEAN